MEYDHCPECHYGKQQRELGAYILTRSKFPLIVPDVIFMRCDLCGHVEFGDLRLALLMEALNYPSQQSKPRRKRSNKKISGMKDKKQEANL